MNIQLKIILVILSLVSGMIAIVLSNRTMKKYQLPYLSSYFYFIVFLYIFSVYSIIGSHSIEFLLNYHQSPPESIQSSKGVLIVLGVPFLILSWYMFIRLCNEFFRRELSRIFVILFFSMFAVSFTAYILLNINIGGQQLISFFLEKNQLIWTFTILNLLAFMFPSITVLYRLRMLKDVNQRNAYRMFSINYLIITIMFLSSLHLSGIHELFGMLFVFILTGSHLVPALFLNIYLQRFFVREVEDPGFEEKLKEMTEAYDISKREAEIVELICKGMSNQEISDSLFISLQTVKDHVHRIFTKTGVKNRVQLTNLLS